MARIALVIAPDRFRDEELLDTTQALHHAGHETVVVGTAVGPVRGMLGATAQVAMTLEDAAAAAFDGVVFIGGGGAEAYFDDPRAHALAREAAARGAVVGAICVAPVILARAGLLDDRPATAFPDVVEDLRRAGGCYAGPGVVASGRIVTADGPASATAFGRRIAAVLASPPPPTRKSQAVRESAWNVRV